MVGLSRLKPHAITFTSCTRNTIITTGNRFITDLRQTHGQQHLWSENSGVTNLHPLGQTLVVAEDLHAGLGVGVVGRFEPQLLDAKLLEELIQDTNQITQS